MTGPLQLDTGILKLTAGETVTERHIRIIAAIHERAVLLANEAEKHASNVDGETRRYREALTHIERVYLARTEPPPAATARKLPS